MYSICFTFTIFSRYAFLIQNVMLYEKLFFIYLVRGNLIQNVQIKDKTLAKRNIQSTFLLKKKIISYDFYLFLFFFLSCVVFSCIYFIPVSSNAILTLHTLLILLINAFHEITHLYIYYIVTRVY